MTELIKYKAARAALAEARSVDEVLTIRDKAEAVRAYAQMANDQQLETDAAEIRIRAVRRLGEMLEQGQHEGAIYSRGGDRKSNPPPIGLKGLGINDRLARDAHVYASFSENEFEEKIANWRKKCLSERGFNEGPFKGVAKAQRRA